MVDVLLGLQWGDEGKGKIVDYLAPDYHIVARFQGGPNAGHTLKFDGRKIVLHTVPSGIFRPDIINYIGSGVVIDPVTLARELTLVGQVMPGATGRLRISDGAHLILPTHRMLDLASEVAKGKQKIGSTLKGIGPAYMDKTGRNGLRIGDLTLPGFRARYERLRDKHLKLLKLYPEVDFDWQSEEARWLEAIDQIRQLPVVEGRYFINDALDSGQKVLAEGAQGTMLDIDYGTYPYVTSSNTVTAGCCTGLGIAPARIGRVIGVFKAYVTRVGSGPFPTELHGTAGETLRRAGNEFGATTGRPRRCGWLDLVQLKYAIMINGVTDLAMTKMDVLDGRDTIRYAEAYEIEGRRTTHFPFDAGAVPVAPVYREVAAWKQPTADLTDHTKLPEEAAAYIRLIESQTKTPIRFISTGGTRKALIVK